MGDFGLTAIDLFAGAGGATQGLRDAGVNVLAAVEIDGDAAETYSRNHRDVKLVVKDIKRVSATSLRRDLGLDVGELSILKACPPCQGFSTLSGGRISMDDVRNSLILQVRKFVSKFQPSYVIIENVPGLRKDPRLSAFVAFLRAKKYAVSTYVVDAKDFGVPQRRKRFIVLGSRIGAEVLPPSLPCKKFKQRSVRDAFFGLENLCGAADPLSVARKQSEIVAQRIRAIPVGGNRYDLPVSLQLPCHRRMEATGMRGATASYGRLKWDEPAVTMTTRCTTVACGTFIHPSENRAITLREAATLQGFPPSYEFHGSYSSIERQIGNAVPCGLVTELVNSIKAGEWETRL